jgi:hypothetical protein
MSGNKRNSATLESATNHLEAALGYEVTGSNIDLTSGKVELTLGSKKDSTSWNPEAATEGGDEDVSFGDMEWNDLVSVASKAGLFESGDGREDLEAKLREADVSPEGTAAPEPSGFDPEEIRAKLEEGEIDDSDAKGILKDNDATPSEWETVFGECQSVKDCGHAANGTEAVFCFGCQKQKVAPDPDAFGISEEQSAAAASLWEADDDKSIAEILRIFN